MDEKLPSLWWNISTIWLYINMLSILKYFHKIILEFSYNLNDCVWLFSVNAVDKWTWTSNLLCDVQKHAPQNLLKISFLPLSHTEYFWKCCLYWNIFIRLSSNSVIIWMIVSDCSVSMQLINGLEQVIFFVMFRSMLLKTFWKFLSYLSAILNISENAVYIETFS